MDDEDNLPVQCHPPNELKTKKETFKKNLEDLIHQIEEKYDTSQSIKIYGYLDSIIKEELEKINQPIQKCNSCGETLDPWEKLLCGPCKIANPRYQEEK